MTLTVFKPQTPALTPTPDNTLKGAVDTKSDLSICVPSFLEVCLLVVDLEESLTSGTDVGE